MARLVSNGLRKLKEAGCLAPRTSSSDQWLVLRTIGFEGSGKWGVPPLAPHLFFEGSLRECFIPRTSPS